MNTDLKNIMLTPFNILYKINSEFELKIMFYLKQGYKLNLKNPKTYSEKLQWIKLNDKNELMPICADKYLVRQYVKDCGCGKILNDLLWQGFDANDIPFDNLPDKFVIKTTHGSTHNIICKDKNKLNRKNTIKQLNKWLKQKYLLCYGEWFYGIQKPRIIVEKFLDDQEHDVLYDYKVFCFNGKPKFIGVYFDRGLKSTKSNFYDTNLELIENLSFGYPNDKSQFIEHKDKVKELFEYAKKLSKDFRHVRVDFYIVNRKIYFGEMTFIHGSGFDKVDSMEHDIKIGNLIKLDVKCGAYN